MPNSSCMGCTERHEGCHSECEKYKAFRKELDEQNERRRMYNESLREDIEDTIKRRHFWRKKNS